MKMGWVSCQEDIEKVAEGASATPMTIIEVKGVPYHSEKARLARIASKGKNKRPIRSLKSKNSTKAAKKAERLKALELENEKLKLKLGRVVI
jgi:hypothetical protein